MASELFPNISSSGSQTGDCLENPKVCMVEESSLFMKNVQGSEACLVQSVGYEAGSQILKKEEQGKENRSSQVQVTFRSSCLGMFQEVGSSFLRKILPRVFSNRQPSDWGSSLVLAAPVSLSHPQRCSWSQAWSWACLTWGGWSRSYRAPLMPRWYPWSWPSPSGYLSTSWNKTCSHPGDQTLDRHEKLRERENHVRKK